MVAEQKGLVVLSASELGRVDLIDGGDTVAVRLEAPDGREIALTLTRLVAARLGHRLVSLIKPPRL